MLVERYQLPFTENRVTALLESQSSLAWLLRGDAHVKPRHAPRFHVFVRNFQIDLMFFGVDCNCIAVVNQHCLFRKLADHTGGGNFAERVLAKRCKGVDGWCGGHGIPKLRATREC